MHLYVIRHGQSFVNLPDWDGKDSNMPLTPTGEKQAQALADWLPAYLPAVNVIYSSTMRRARKTAEIVAAAYHMDIQPDARLRELGNNKIDHSPYPDDASPPRFDWSAYWASERPFAPVTTNEGGESAMHFRIRVAAFLEEMIEIHPKQTVMAVCHGGVMDAVFDYCFGIGPWRRCEINTYNTGVSHFEYIALAGRETWRLYQHNSIEHLRAAEGLIT